MRYLITYNLFEQGSI